MTAPGHFAQPGPVPVLGLLVRAGPVPVNFARPAWKRLRSISKLWPQLGRRPAEAACRGRQPPYRFRIRRTLPRLPTILVEPGILACEGLPAQDRNVDIGRVDINREAGAAGHFRRDDGSARPAE
jgi:hypothetical protein